MLRGGVGTMITNRIGKHGKRANGEINLELMNSGNERFLRIGWGAGAVCLQQGASPDFRALPRWRELACSTRVAV